MLLEDLIDLSLLNFEINKNIFETNIINILILVIFLFNIIGTYLKTLMSKRKIKILEEIQSAETNLTKGSKRLFDSKLQFEQVGLIVQQINDKTSKIKNKILISDWNDNYKKIYHIKKHK